MTTEEIAATAGVSISTYYRYAPSKEGLLVEPVREAMAEIVAAYSNRPATESTVEALIQVFVTHAHATGDPNREMWRQAFSTTPQLLTTTTLITDRDRSTLIERVSLRLGVNASDDMDPSLLVHTCLATVKYVLDLWLTASSLTDPPFHQQLDRASRKALAGF